MAGHWYSDDLLLLAGNWHDDRGNSYELRADSDSTLSVHTTRPDGTRIFTRRMIHIDRNHQVVWGWRRRYMLYDISGSSDGTPFRLSWAFTANGLTIEALPDLYRWCRDGHSDRVPPPAPPL